MTDITAEPVEVPQPLAAPLGSTEGVSERPCEVCAELVNHNDRWEILRADGPAWRHPWHTEPV